MCLFHTSKSPRFAYPILLASHKILVKPLHFILLVKLNIKPLEIIELFFVRETPLCTLVEIYCTTRRCTEVSRREGCGISNRRLTKNLSPDGIVKGRAAGRGFQPKRSWLLLRFNIEILGDCNVPLLAPVPDMGPYSSSGQLTEGSTNHLVPVHHNSSA